MIKKIRGFSFGFRCQNRMKNWIFQSLNESVNDKSKEALVKLIPFFPAVKI